MNIVICEDEKIYGKYVEQILRDYINATGSNAKIVLNVNRADEVMDYIYTNAEVTLYFLDIKLNDGQSGFDIAAEIRKEDHMSHIVFITNYGEMMPLTYEYKFEALDYIVKSQTGEVERKICECLEYAEKRQKIGYDKCLNIQNKRSNLSVPFDEICYIGSIKSSHKLVLYYENGIIEFYSLLKDVEKMLDDRFMRCHKSIIVNKNKIIGVDKKEHTLTLSGGYKCEYAPRYKGVLEKWN